MSSCSKRVREADAPESPEQRQDRVLRAAKMSLPWPRSAGDGTKLGVDLRLSYRDVRKLTGKFLSMNSTRRKILQCVGERSGAGRAFYPEDFEQDILMTIHRRNHMPSAFDPRRGRLSTYVFQVCHSVMRTKIRNLKESCDASTRMELREEADLGDHLRSIETRMDEDAESLVDLA